MKRLSKLFFTVASIAALTACSNDKDSFDGFDYSGESTVKFTSNIRNYSTKVVDNNWSTGDAIGLYAVEMGQELSDGAIFDNKKNIKYTTATSGANGAFTAAIPTEAVQLRGSKKVDVVAYYPFSSTLTGYEYAIDVQNQSNWSAIDLLYSNNATQVGASAINEMKFKHQLSRIILQVEPGNGVNSLTGLVAKNLENVKAKGVMNLKDGSVRLADGASNVSITPRTTVSGNNVLIETLLIPSQNLNTAKLVMVLNGQDFTWEPKNDINLESGKKYTYRVQLSADGSVVVLNPSGSIEDWVEGNPDGGVEVITPGGTVDPSGDVTVNTTNLQLGANGETQNLSITASSEDLAWNISSTDSWISLDKNAGSGSDIVKVTVSANTATTARTGSITLTAGSQNVTIAVTQAGEDGGQTGQEVEFFKENFAKVTDGKKLESFSAEYKNYIDNPSLDYEVSYDKNSLRSTSTTSGHIWFGANYENWFKMLNIDVTGYSDLKIKFSLVANQPNVANTSAFTVKVNDVQLEALPSEILAGGAEFKEFTLNIPQPTSNSITIQFTANLVGVTQGIRLNNIILVGTK